MTLRLAGVQIGMPIHEALKIAPQAALVGPNEAEYHARHDAIYKALQQFTNAIEVVALGEFLLDIRGLDRLHDGEPHLARLLCSTAHDASLLAIRVGIGSGKFVAQRAAYQTAHHSALVVPEGTEKDFLAQLPLTALPNLPAEILRRLTLFDIHDFRGFTALRKAAVLRQFGNEASVFYELARGFDPRPLEPGIPPLRIVRSKKLLEPVDDRQQLYNLVRHLTLRLSKQLNIQGYHAEAVKLTLEVGRRAPIHLERSLPLKPPTADPTALDRVTALLMDRLAADDSVTKVTLCAYPLRSWHLQSRQLALLQTGQVPEKQAKLENTLQLLVHRFGRAMVHIAALIAQPPPLPITVRTRPDGTPTQYRLGQEGQHYIDAIDEFWQEERNWWSKPVRRHYYRVLLADGSLRNLFKDLNNGDWFVDRAWPIL